MPADRAGGVGGWVRDSKRLGCGAAYRGSGVHALAEGRQILRDVVEDALAPKAQRIDLRGGQGRAREQACEELGGIDLVRVLE